MDEHATDRAEAELAPLSVAQALRLIQEELTELLVFAAGHLGPRESHTRIMSKISAALDRVKALRKAYDEARDPPTD